MKRQSTMIHRNLTGTDAERLLMEGGEDGSFLLRPSRSDPGGFSLSFRYLLKLTIKQNNKVTHVKIMNRGDHFEINEKEQFATLPELIDSYVKGFTKLEVAGNTVNLRKPLVQAVPATERLQKWYHGGLDGLKAEEILLQPAQLNGSFLVRDSTTKPGEYVLSAKTGAKTVKHVKINHRSGKFDINYGETFNTVDALVNHYRCHPVELSDGVKFTLSQAVISSKFQACDIENRIAALSHVYETNAEHRNGFWEEFQYLEQLETSGSTDSHRTVGLKPENSAKNRYKNILPFDDTRVILHTDSDPSKPESDYINANHVYCMTDPKKKYIATQGCLVDTIGDFWRMVWQENSRVIAMVTEIIEMGRNKCVQYWPEKVGDEMLHIAQGSVYVVKLINSMNLTEYELHQLELYRESHVSKKSKQRVTPKRSETRIIYHYQYRKWPDKHVPSDARPILAYINDINHKQASEDCAGPIIVHCSAGIGRSGALMLIDIITSHILKHGVKCEIDIMQAVLELRKQRSGMVQTEIQYQFAYTAIKLFIDNLLNQQKASGAVKELSSPTQEVYANISQIQTQKDLQPKSREYVNIPPTL